VERYYYIFNIALEAVIVNRVRSILTALGIIFGVAAVISMMAIGTGARQEILDQMKLVGVNNIIITPTDNSSEEDQDGEDSEQQKQNKYSPGLTYKDAQSILEIIPTVAAVSSEVIYETDIISGDVRKSGKLIGVTESFFDLFNLKVKKGKRFSQYQIENGEPVCIIGPELKSIYFKGRNPIGNYIKCDNQWFKVIGILEGKGISKENSKDLKITNTDKNVYVPLQTVLLRYKDRSVINDYDLRGRRRSNQGGSFTTVNQLDKIVVQVESSEELAATQELIHRMLLRRHYGIEDFNITVPELLLKQEQKTKDIFQIVLVAIAGISLIVGGIGIMNIMLASVMERIREIGTRRATGATRKDIILQFLTEAILISVSGGILGIVLGIVLAELISSFTDINTIISPVSILVSFGVSATVGIIFGFMPARRAAQMDPVESLRYQ
jgi:putative ABC transport system permease protein